MLGRAVTTYCLAMLLTMPVMANTLRVAYDADPVSLDPHEQLSEGILQLSHLVFDPLVRWSPNKTIEPRLATHWETINPTTVRFWLRPNVAFHSGQPLTAYDVQWTLRRIKRSADFKQLFSGIQQINIVDELSFDVITTSPSPLLLNQLTYLFPMDRTFYSGTEENGNAKDALIAYGNTFASRHTSGTGPFIITDREPGISLSFKRNNHYWDDNSPGNVDTIILTPIKSAPTRLAALLAGDIDLMSPVPPHSFNRLLTSDTTNLVTLPGARIILMQMNQKRRPEFRDKRVRQAIVHAINQEGIADKIMKGMASPSGQLSPKGFQGHNPALLPRFNLAKAKQLMKSAGYEDGFEITMLAPNNRYVNDAKIAQAMANMLAKINIRVALRTLPKAQYWNAFAADAADMMMVGWHPDTEDSNNFYQFLVACPNTQTGAGKYNKNHYCNAEVDQHIANADIEMNSVKRRHILQTIESILYRDAAFVPLHWQNIAWGAAIDVDIAPVVSTHNLPYLGDLVMQTAEGTAP